MAKITFDGVEVEVPDGTTILNAARQIGGSIVPPAMCYYTPLKGSGGKCRACLVRVAAGSTKDPRPMPKLVASCVTPVQDGMVVENTTSEQVLNVRKGIVEMLLINHPLDCPVCDQAGECDLQNFAFEHGVSTTRYQEERRTFEKIDIGPLIQLHMTRCILCYRCVYTADQIVKGDRVHGVLGRGDAAEIGTYIENIIDDDFSGNVIDVCPVGALTDKTFRFKQRVWFTKPVNAHRDCPKCSGNVVLWYKGKDVLRVTARKDEYGEVKEWICNECRFEKKETSDWTIEGPAHIDRSSVISANHYELPVLNQSVIADLPESTQRELEKNPPLKLG
ncbi:2Fe-2S iron-sulfur cluster binding domain-containing protein [Hymenobacter taeanensis]|jgi:NADH-quinone oxidoreductase subunit G|uniref:2Fe-2S iron-sulfur cluster binding domain-containing protein n=1 Tax=Hymenobacter taeanensis TaxID=2735321 RepID=A0A6M6BHN0_9BACT|nr:MULTISPECIES: 2Fe-2S iron-sulfur cluster-binding protein [Hymenobacter]QJX47294.1 2Fe-2S iron-sulfur cluster binding domain-containing protein [Hymenobacter taeanensis]UOQ79369.1 2Fe-2S iron-sulfur cluster-binding protein [Hymenobacter sp. 5414T-23]